MKKTIITALIIIITINVNGQKCSDLLKSEGIVALFERKIESTYDSIKQDFVNEKKYVERTLFYLRGEEIELGEKKYNIIETEIESTHNKQYNMIFNSVKNYCKSEFGEEYIIEYTQSENVIYNVSIYAWITNTKVIKTIYKH